MAARFLWWLVLAGFVAAAPAYAQDARDSNAEVARGQYLAVLGDCAGCHTVAHQPAFSGGLAFSAQFGTVYSTNITPDRDTGIGAWTNDQFYRALHQGIAADGHHLYPAFPYLYFARTSRADSDALLAYLKSLKPVYRRPTPNRVIFPLNIRVLMTIWNWLYLDDRPFTPDPAKSAAVNRGQYLVTGLGHCAACHTPKNFLFGDEADKALTGTVLENWFSANLTGSLVEGLGKWSAGDIAHYLATGRNSYATAAGSMQEKVSLSTSRMRDEDRAAIAAYLKTQPSRQPASFPAADVAQMGRGEAVFVARCAYCHQPAGIPDTLSEGGLADYPKLPGDTLVIGRDPTTVLHIILEGADAPVTQNEHTTFAMPAFGTLSDGEVADVATYIRNAWSNRAPSVNRGDVAKLRRAIAAEPD
jgi:mono/diheme cytochrome c family protein